MIMDSQFGADDFLNYDNFFNKDPFVDLSSLDFHPLQTDTVPGNLTSSSSSGSSDDAGSEVLKYISQVLMDENVDEKPSMFYDPLVLQAAEKPFYDALGHIYPLSPNQHPLLDHDSPGDNSLGSGDFCDTTRAVDSVESDVEKSSISHGAFLPENPSLPVGYNIFSDKESMKLFQKGVEEASKFLPKASNLVIDLDNITSPEETKGDYSTSVPQARKIHYLDDEDLEEGRSSKQSALSMEETEDLSELLDRVLLCHPKTNENGCEGDFVQRLKLEGSVKKHDDGKSVVDLRNLLILGAQAAASDNWRTSRELLKQIRLNSSHQGDGSQRLAHYFANALEARMEGTGSDIYTALASKRTSTSQILKAYQFFVSLCPFWRMSMMFSNLNILKLAENRKKLHIIDFGICYGFQWPVLIQLLSQRPGGPPALRITGVDVPQPGFRPKDNLEETGRRLAKYCERFGVPFEFSAIAQKWETIKVEDFKFEEDEFVAVNCLYRLKNLLDETIAVDSPRDAVLNLIKKIKPDLFVHGIANGSLSAPFFITRFREALFYYSTLFDMLDTNAPQENVERSMFEREFYGREIMNVVACEGTERVERPEIYKQWHVRNTKAGFRQLPLDEEIMNGGRYKMKFYHKDYSLNVDGNWALMGWKGRVVYAVSAWAPL